MSETVTVPTSSLDLSSVTSSSITFGILIEYLHSEQTFYSSDSTAAPTFAPVTMQLLFCRSTLHITWGVISPSTLPQISHVSDSAGNFFFSASFFRICFSPTPAGRVTGRSFGHADFT